MIGCFPSFARQKIVRHLAVIANTHLFREFEIVYWAALNAESELKLVAISTQLAHAASPSVENVILERLLMTAYSVKLKLSMPRTEEAERVFFENECDAFVSRYGKWAKDKILPVVSTKCIIKTKTKLLGCEIDTDADNLNITLSQLLDKPSGQAARYERVRKIRKTVDDTKQPLYNIFDIKQS